MACLLALAADAIRSTRAPAMPWALNSVIAASSRRRLVSCESQGMPRTLQPTGWIDKEPLPCLDDHVNPTRWFSARRMAYAVVWTNVLGAGWHSAPAGRTPKERRPAVKAG